MHNSRFLRVLSRRESIIVIRINWTTFRLLVREATRSTSFILNAEVGDRWNISRTGVFLSLLFCLEINARSIRENRIRFRCCARRREINCCWVARASREARPTHVASGASTGAACPSTSTPLAGHFCSKMGSTLLESFTSSVVVDSASLSRPFTKVHTRQRFDFISRRLLKPPQTFFRRHSQSIKRISSVINI